MSEEYRTYLFSYRFAGAEWGFEIKAQSADEARARVRTLCNARYDGELKARIPAAAGAGGILARLVCWWNNR